MLIPPSANTVAVKPNTITNASSSAINRFFIFVPSLSIASFSLCLVRRGFVVHLPRLPVLDGSSCPGSRFTAHTPRLLTSIFCALLHYNIKTLYCSLSGYHTNTILTRWNLAIFPISRTIDFFINADNRGETSRKSGRTQSIKGSSGFSVLFVAASPVCRTRTGAGDWLLPCLISFLRSPFPD